MAPHPTPAPQPQGAGHAGGPALHHDINLQRLRILRCTAQAMASTPGGLRFKAGTRPWLDGLAVRPSAPRQGPRRDAPARSSLN